VHETQSKTVTPTAGSASCTSSEVDGAAAAVTDAALAAEPRPVVGSTGEGGADSAPKGRATRPDGEFKMLSDLLREPPPPPVFDSKGSVKEHARGQITDVVAAPFAGADPAKVLAAPSVNSVHSSDAAQASTASSAITSINEHLQRSAGSKSKRAWPDYEHRVKKRGKLRSQQGACGRQCSLDCQQDDSEVAAFIGPVEPQ
jgi:hypothetical protein